MEFITRKSTLKLMAHQRGSLYAGSDFMPRLSFWVCRSRACTPPCAIDTAAETYHDKVLRSTVPLLDARSFIRSGKPHATLKVERARFRTDKSCAGCGMLFLRQDSRSKPCLRFGLLSKIRGSSYSLREHRLQTNS